MALIIYITCYLSSKDPFSAKSNLHTFLSLVMTLAEEKTAFPPVCGSGGSCKNVKNDTCNVSFCATTNRQGVCVHDDGM